MVNRNTKILNIFFSWSLIANTDLTYGIPYPAPSNNNLLCILLKLSLRKCCCNNTIIKQTFPKTYTAYVISRTKSTPPAPSPLHLHKFNLLIFWKNFWIIDFGLPRFSSVSLLWQPLQPPLHVQFNNHYFLYFLYFIHLVYFLFIENVCRNRINEMK